MPSSAARAEHRTRLPSASCTLTATGTTSVTARARHFYPPASPRGLLEPDAWKRARPVLRGAGRSNAPGLPGLAAVVGGLLAGVVGTICLDTAGYLRYRGTGGKKSPLEWEFGPIDGWENASDPGKVAKREIEGFTGRELPDRWAWPLSTAMHWGYGSAAAALYGIVAGSVREPS